MYKRVFANTISLNVLFHLGHSSLCHFCGGPVEHTRSKTGRLITGTVLCRNKGCPSEGRLHCRDVTGALSVGARFVVGYLLCGFLGNFSCDARKDAQGLLPAGDRVSLFRIMIALLSKSLPPRAAAATQPALPV